MKRRLSVLIVVVVLALMSVVPAFANRGDGALGVIYVTSQGLYYDTFVTNETLPMQGQFQKLTNHVTDYGPGDPGYRGGRWWVWQVPSTEPRRRRTCGLIRKECVWEPEASSISRTSMVRQSPSSTGMVFATA